MDDAFDTFVFALDFVLEPGTDVGVDKYRLLLLFLLLLLCDDGLMGDWFGNGDGVFCTG